jgi:hypothetical protein
MRAMSGHVRERPVVFRATGLVAFGWVGLAIIALLFGVAASDIGGGGTFGVALLIAAVSYVFWVWCCTSSVRMDRSGMIVDDVLTRHVIPWPELRQITVAGGMVIELRGGSNIRPMMYGGSLYGAVTGYRRQRRVAARMNAAWQRLQASAPTPQSPAHYAQRTALSPWPPLLILVAMEAIATVGVLTK